MNLNWCYGLPIYGQSCVFTPEQLHSDLGTKSYTIQDSSHISSVGVAAATSLVSSILHCYTVCFFLNTQSGNVD